MRRKDLATSPLPELSKLQAIYGVAVEEVQISIEDGHIATDESWVYAWIKPNGDVFYVGATGLPIETRTWLHLNSEEPQIGRVRANYPDALVDRVDVRAWKLPTGSDRQLIRTLLAAELTSGPAPQEAPDPASVAAANEILASLQQE